MKAQHLSLAAAGLVAAGGLWFAVSAWRAHHHPLTTNEANSIPATSALAGFPESSTSRDSRALHTRTNASPMLNARARPAPPDPNRRFTDFTPEQRVQFARQGHGPGG